MSNLAEKYNPKQDFKREMIDGAITMMSPRPRMRHDDVAGNILRIFEKGLKGRKCRPFDERRVFLTENDMFIPDAMIVCNRHFVKADGIHGPPNLLVEVLSPSTASRDKGYKKDVYENCGVSEYWLVNCESRWIEVYLLKNGKFELDNVYVQHDDDWINRTTQENRDAIVYEFKASIFDDLIIRVADVFDGINF